MTKHRELLKYLYTAYTREQHFAAISFTSDRLPSTMWISEWHNIYHMFMQVLQILSDIKCVNLKVIWGICYDLIHRPLGDFKRILDNWLLC